MLSKIVRIEPRPARHLFVELTDGTSGVINLGGLSGPVWDPHQDQAYFERVVLDEEFHAPTWPNGADICPDVIVDMLTGRAAS